MLPTLALFDQARTRLVASRAPNTTPAATPPRSISITADDPACSTPPMPVFGGAGVAVAAPTDAGVDAGRVVATGVALADGVAKAVAVAVAVAVGVPCAGA